MLQFSINRNLNQMTKTRHVYCLVPKNKEVSTYEPERSESNEHDTNPNTCLLLRSRNNK